MIRDPEIDVVMGPKLQNAFSKRVLVACEFSGTVRDAFIAAGHDAISVDFLPSATPGPHHQGDVFEFLERAEPFDLVIAHPPCTYLSNAGVHRLMGADGMIDEGPGSRWQKMLDACEFFNRFKGVAPRVAIENPIPHGYARHRIGKYDQRVEPWMFGHPVRKATCLWLENVPPLMATHIETIRETWVEAVAPGPDQWALRSMTFPGIAAAMADQWGSL